MVKKPSPLHDVTRRQVDCAQCPLRTLKSFRAFTPDELQFVEQFKIGEMRLGPGRSVLVEGTTSPHLYTVLSGWLIKAKTLDDGRRQIINYALPGDLLGLQGALFETMQHSVEALTDVTLCVFDKQKLWTLYERFHGLAFDMTWIAAQEKTILAEYLVSVGQRTATERIAFVLLTLYRRARAVGLERHRKVHLPLTQEHLADTVGFSLVHTNKRLGRLRRSGAFDWTGDIFRMIDEDLLTALAANPPALNGKRPFI